MQPKICLISRKPPLSLINLLLEKIHIQLLSEMRILEGPALENLLCQSLIREQLLQMLRQELLFKRQSYPCPSPTHISFYFTHVLNVPSGKKEEEEEAQLTSIGKHFYTTEKLTISVRLEKPQAHGIRIKRMSFLSEYIHQLE